MEGTTVLIDKSKVLALVEEQAPANLERAQAELPDLVHPENDEALLRSLGVDTADLLGDASDGRLEGLPTDVGKLAGS